jgi:hypothetical protein
MYKGMVQQAVGYACTGKFRFILPGPFNTVVY